MTILSADSFRVFEMTFWLSLFAAPLGCFLCFRRLSFVGDALGHSTLAGVSIAYLFFGASFFALSLGAVAAALAATALLYIFERVFKLPSDTALTVSYSSLFALGLFLLARAQLHLDHFLVGDIWTANIQALWFMRIWGIIVVGVIIVFWRRLWLEVIDPQLARSLGYKNWISDLILLVLVSISVVGMLQVVGMVLMASYLVFPAATSLPWARSLSQMMIGAILSALVSSFLGVIVSSFFTGFVSGPLLALSAAFIFLLSHLSHWILRKNRVS